MKHDAFDTTSATKLSAIANTAIAALFMRARKDQPCRKAKDVVLPTTLLMDDFFGVL